MDICYEQNSLSNLQGYLKIMTFLTFLVDYLVCFLSLIIILINIYQQMIPKNCKWQQYNQQQDVGLLTIFHLQDIQGRSEAKNTLGSMSYLKPIFKKIVIKNKEKEISELQMDLCNRGIQIQHIESKKRQNQTRICKHKQPNPAPNKQRYPPLHIQRCKSIESKSKSRKASIKLGYYDVAHMSMVLNSRPIKNSCYSRKTLLAQENEQKSEKIKKSMKTLQKPKSKQLLNEKRQQSYLQVYAKRIKQLIVHHQLKSLSCHSISQIPQCDDNSIKLINLQKKKLRKIKENFRAVLKKQIQTLSERTHCFLQEKDRMHFEKFQDKNIVKKHQNLKPVERLGLICQSRSFSSSKILAEHHLRQVFQPDQANSNCRNRKSLEC